MGLREGFERVLDEYIYASQHENFRKHELANHIREVLRNAVAESVHADKQFFIKGSSGQGNWARGPWVGIFDRLVTTGAQSGYYPVYLFREDMSGLYLSLNQGMTEAKRLYRTDAKTALTSRSANFRAMLGRATSPFPENAIDLRPTAPTNDTAFYEAGNICAKFYAKNHLPSEEVLMRDVMTMVQLYSTLSQAIMAGEVNSTTFEEDEPPQIAYEDATRFKLHKRIERNAKLAKDVKKHHGYSCQVCSINFEDLYGDIGKDYIEAHHLTPLASIKGQKVALDPVTDFAVLCSNCHRMIHRSGVVGEINQFKKEHFRG